VSDGTRSLLAQNNSRLRIFGLYQCFAPRHEATLAHTVLDALIGKGSVSSRAVRHVTLDLHSTEYAMMAPTVALAVEPVLAVSCLLVAQRKLRLMPLLCLLSQKREQLQTLSFGGQPISLQSLYDPTTRSQALRYWNAIESSGSRTAETTDRIQYNALEIALLLRLLQPRLNVRSDSFYLRRLRFCAACACSRLSQARSPNTLWHGIRIGPLMLRPIDVLRPTLAELAPHTGGWLGPRAEALYYGVLSLLLAQHQHLKLLAIELTELGPHMTEMLKVCLLSCPVSNSVSHCLHECCRPKLLSKLCRSARPPLTLRLRGSSATCKTCVQ
jgi:hypothetical protein